MESRNRFKYIPKFSKTNIELKEINKQKLIEEVGLNFKEVPLFGFVGRLASQKGVDIFSDSLKDFLKKMYFLLC